MTGLLRSLAAQALNMPSRMRPAARLRAGTSSGSSEMAQEYDISLARSPVGTERSIVEHALERRPDPASTAASATHATMPDRDVHQQGAADRTLAVPTATSEIHDGNLLRSMPRAREVVEPREVSLAEAPAPAPTPRVATREVDAGNASVPAARSIPVQPRMSSRGLPPRFEMSVREQTAREPAATDVHIHINRVELTAVTAPAPSRRASASQASKPMSLDQYLQQRKRKTP